MWSIRSVLNDDERRISPCTSYPLANSSSARYEPSCPVIPVISADFVTAAGYLLRQRSGEPTGPLVPEMGTRLHLRELGGWNVR